MTRNVIALHGFTQVGASWDAVGVALSSLLPSIRFLTPDMPGHGSRSHDPLNLDQASDVLAEELPGGIWIGYSMGGRHLLNLALRHPDRCIGLVLVSTTAGIDDPDERAARRRADAITADRIRSIGVNEFIREWTAQPMFDGRLDDVGELATRLANTPDGLAGSLQQAGTGSQTPLWSDLGSIRVPTLIVTGSEDTKFTAIGDRLASCISGAAHEVLAGAGHALHLERPDEFASLVTKWIRQQFPDLR